MPQTVTDLCASMPVAPFLLTFVQYLIVFCSRPEEASDIVSGRFVRLAVLDKCIQFCDHRLNYSQETRPEAVGGGIFDRFFLTSINADWKQLATGLSNRSAWMSLQYLVVVGVKQSPNYSTFGRSTHFCGHIELHFAVDWKRLVMSNLADLWGRSSTISA